MNEIRYIGRRKPKGKGGINKKLPPEYNNNNQDKGFRKGMKDKLKKRLLEDNDGK